MKKVMSYEERFYSSAIYEDDDPRFEDFGYSRSFEIEIGSYGMGDHRIERMEASITYRLRAIA